MNRVSNWPELLAAYIEARRHTPFRWGVHDCCLFAADWVQACCGFDPAATLRGYNSALGAMRLVRLHGQAVDDLPGALGFLEIPCEMAGRGDMVSVHTEHGPALGLCIGPQLVAAGPDGLSFLPRREARRAWGI